MPSSGILAEETDRSVILRHETVLLDHVHESAMVGSEAAKGPALVAAAGLGRMEQVKQLLHFLKVSQKGWGKGVGGSQRAEAPPRPSLRIPPECRLRRGAIRDHRGVPQARLWRHGPFWDPCRGRGLLILGAADDHCQCWG